MPPVVSKFDTDCDTWRHVLDLGISPVAGAQCVECARRIHDRGAERVRRTKRGIGNAQHTTEIPDRVGCQVGIDARVEERRLVDPVPLPKGRSPSIPATMRSVLDSYSEVRGPIVVVGRIRNVPVSPVGLFGFVAGTIVPAG